MIFLYMDGGPSQVDTFDPKPLLDKYNGKDPGELTTKVDRDSILVRVPSKDDSGGGAPPLHSAPKGTRQFEAKVDGLTPDTLYYYGIFDGDKRLTPPDTSNQNPQGSERCMSPHAPAMNANSISTRKGFSA